MSTQPVSDGARRTAAEIHSTHWSCGECKDCIAPYEECGKERDDIAAIIDRHMRGEDAKRNAEWLREIQDHPEFGGHNLDRASESVAGLLRRFGSPLLLAQIRQMELQNWPEMFYFLARIAQSFANSAAEIDRLKRKEGEGCKGK